ncbi:uncharacterized protein LOC133803500 [Humulus lupulus]|uniref:uncharacterized protein LOC133803500 n=1 Tax=Humulus lupulus TaxID=3486 RepID=UPI002B409483|nr:uncharacterized protein LOC133803500 [Humulus lupulus]
MLLVGHAFRRLDNLGQGSRRRCRWFSALQGCSELQEVSTLQVFSATTAVAAEVSVEFENPLKSSMKGSERRQLRTNGGSRSGCGFGRTAGVSPPKASHGLTTHRVIAWEEK